jgi:hypothetical protein
MKEIKDSWNQINISNNADKRMIDGIISHNEEYIRKRVGGSVMRQLTAVLAALIMIIGGSALGVFYMANMNDEIEIEPIDTAVTEIYTHGIQSTESGQENPAPTESPVTTETSGQENFTPTESPVTTETSGQENPTPAETPVTTAVIGQENHTPTESPITAQLPRITTPRVTSGRENPTPTEPPRTTTAPLQPFPTPDGYNNHDYQKLVSFALQGNNLEILGWDLKDPQSWGAQYFNGISQFGIKWNNAPVKSVTQVELVRENANCYAVEFPISGKLDLSGFRSLEFVWVEKTNITWLDVSNNPVLTNLDVSNNKISVLNTDNSSAIKRLDIIANNLPNLSSIENLQNLHAVNVTFNNLDLNCPVILASIAKIKAAINRNRTDIHSHNLWYKEQCIWGNSFRVQLLAREAVDWVTDLSNQGPFRGNTVTITGNGQYTASINTGGYSSLAQLGLYSYGAVFDDLIMMNNAVKAPTTWANATIRFDRITANGGTVVLASNLSFDSLVYYGWAPVEGFVYTDLWNAWFSPTHSNFPNVTPVATDSFSLESPSFSIGVPINSIEVTFTVSGIK